MIVLAKDGGRCDGANTEHKNKGPGIDTLPAVLLSHHLDIIRGRPMLTL